MTKKEGAKDSQAGAVTPTHIVDLLKPIAASNDRKVWSIALQGVWIPFFTATNTTGETRIPSDVLGAPLRLAKDKDGTPRFNKMGVPVLRIAKELSDQVRTVRENFAYSLIAHAEAIRQQMPEAYQAQVDAAKAAGAPIKNKDAQDVAGYIAALREEEALSAAVQEAAEAAAAKTEALEPEKELVAA